MDFSIYDDITHIMTTTSVGSERLGVSLGTIAANSDLRTRRVTIGKDGPSFVGRKDRPSDLLSKDGKNALIMILSRGSKTVDVQHITDKILLQNIQQQKTEKVQVTETFREFDPAIFFFGKRTVPYAFSGRLLNSDRIDGKNNTNWCAGFELFWDEHLRGTRLAEQNKIAIMIVDDELYEGYPISLSVNKNSMDEYTAGFSMSWIITNHTTLLNSADLNKFMFYMNDADVNALYNKLLTQQQRLLMFQNFMTFIQIHFPAHMIATDMATLSVEIPLKIEIPRESYMLEKGITEIDVEGAVNSINLFSTNSSNAQWNDLGDRPLRYSEVFKDALKFITRDIPTASTGSPLSVESGMIGSEEDMKLLRSLDISWSEKKPVEPLTLTFRDYSILNRSLDLYQLYVERISQKYTEAVNKMEQEL